MDIKLVISDLDETLLSNSLQYISARQKVFNILGDEHQYTSEQAAAYKEAWATIDKEMFDKLGIWGNRFAVSAVSALQTLGDWDYDLANQIFEAANSFKHVECEPYVQLVKAMCEMQTNGTEIVVLTRGDKTVQNPKLQTLQENGLHPDQFIVVPFKDSSTFDNIISRKGISGDNILVVGDSYSSDIAPAMQVGVKHGIHIDGNKTWSPLEQEAEQYEVTTVSNEIEAVEAIKAYM